MDDAAADARRRRLAAAPFDEAGVNLHAGSLRRGIAAAILLAGCSSNNDATQTAATASRIFHADCSAPSDGDGSPDRPWNSLTSVNAFEFAPGDQLLFARGTSCSGLLQPHGSGTAALPISIGAFGDGAAPRIDGASSDAVLLVDLSHWVVQDLEITNRGAASTARRGVYLVAHDRLVTDVTIRNLYIHDVQGDLSKDTGGSAGIQIDVTAAPPARFDGVRIEGNRIENVSRSGIFIDGGGSSRPRATEPWPTASTGIVVHGNRIAGLAGDGIVPTGTEGTIVEDNVVSDGNKAGRSVDDPQGQICNAGIWTFNANNTVIQRNEVYAFAFNGCDGTGYDIDYDQDGTVVQYNYSHGNGGGFILLCTDDQPRTAEIRFNLSVDDAYVLNQSPCKIESGQVGTLDGLRMYNNTFVTPTSTIYNPGGQALPVLPQAGNFIFANNIVSATSMQTTPFPCGSNCYNNLFFNMPASGTAPVSADPKFVDGARRGEGRVPVGQGFQLQPDSPAIGAGAAIDDAGSEDYFGTALSGPPSIGFFQAPS